MRRTRLPKRWSPSTGCPATLLTLTSVLISGCGPQNNTPTEFTVTDSAGVAIVESTRPIWSEGEGWTVAPEPEVVIGEADGDEGYLLDEVRDVKRFTDGRIAILNGGSSQVRVYDPAGRHLFDVGGPGEGPSELSQGQYLALHHDTIVVYEYLPPTLTWFDGTGEFLRSTRLPGQLKGAPPFGNAFGFLNGSAVAITTPVRPNYNPGRTREVMSIWSLDWRSEEVDSLAEIQTDEITVHNDGGWNNLTFGATTYVAASDSNVYVAPSESYSIRVLDGSGTLRRIIRRAVEPRPVVQSDVRRWAEQTLAALNQDQDPNRVDQITQRMREIGTADVMPAYRMITVDSEENLWVEDWDDVGVDQGAFSVFRPDGAWLGTVTLPPGLPILRGRGLLASVLNIGSDYILGVWVGDYGVEQARLYRIQKG
jgi:hypothetical protein